MTRDHAENKPLSWTCGYCRVEVRWMSGHGDHGLPANWSEEHRGPACLACRRQLAADAGVGDTSLDLTFQERARRRSFALLEFEVTRDPDRSNAQIASAVHTSVVAVQKARERLGAGRRFRLDGFGVGGLRAGLLSLFPLLRRGRGASERTTPTPTLMATAMSTAPIR